MPRLYPGVLSDDEVTLLAGYLKTAIFKCGPNEPQSCAPPTKPMTGGTPAWRAVYSVLTSPRRINCHPVASPKVSPYAFNPATAPSIPRTISARATTATRTTTRFCAATPFLLRQQKIPERYISEWALPLSAAHSATGLRTIR